MAITHALHSAISGLGTNSEGMSVVANNIANANTRSFKTDRAEFEDLMAVSLNENSQLGRGARLRDIYTNFTQGAVTTTGSVTDLAIQGEGFFLVKNDLAEIKESNGLFYTRQGTFNFDRQGKLSDVTGGRIQGYMVQEDGTLSSRLSDVEIPSSSIPPFASTVVNVAANLDVRARPNPEEFDIKRPNETSNFETSVTVFDNYGVGHQCSIYFARDNDMDKNNWKWYAAFDGYDMSKEPELDEKGKPLPVVVGEGQIEFDENGKPILNFVTKFGDKSYIDSADKTDAVEIKFANGAKSQKLQFNFGPEITEAGKAGAQVTTSIAARSGLNFVSQNGYEAGYLKTIKIDLDGVLRGVYTNGLERRLGAVALATFPNNHGLQKIGRNNYISTPKAGEARIGLAQTSSRGSVYSGSLEESNVDLAQQFVDMITSQRGFQANSKAITTTDTLLEEVINLKR